MSPLYLLALCVVAVLANSDDLTKSDLALKLAVAESKLKSTLTNGLRSKSYKNRGRLALDTALDLSDLKALDTASRLGLRTSDTLKSADTLTVKQRKVKALKSLGLLNGADETYLARNAVSLDDLDEQGLANALVNSVRVRNAELDDDTLADDSSLSSLASRLAAEELLDDAARNRNSVNAAVDKRQTINDVHTEESFNNGSGWSDYPEFRRKVVTDRLAYKVDLLQQKLKLLSELLPFSTVDEGKDSYQVSLLAYHTVEALRNYATLGSCSNKYEKAYDAALEKTIKNKNKNWKGWQFAASVRRTLDIVKAIIAKHIEITQKRCLKYTSDDTCNLLVLTASHQESLRCSNIWNHLKILALMADSFEPLEILPPKNLQGNSTGDIEEFVLATREYKDSLKDQFLGLSEVYEKVASYQKYNRLTCMNLRDEVEELH